MEMDVNILKHAYKGRSLLARILNPTLSAPEADTSFYFFAITTTVGNFGGSRHEDDDRLSAAGLDAGLIFGPDDGNRLDRDGKFITFYGSPRIGQPFSHDAYVQPPEPINVTDVIDVIDVIDVAAINEWQ